MPIKGPSLTPLKKIAFWRPRAGGPYLLRLLDGADFDAAARAAGYAEPDKIGAFAIWGRWWARDEIVCRPERLELIAHEIRHLQEGKFHP